MRRILLSSLSACSYFLAQSQTFTTEVGLNYSIQPNIQHELTSFGIVYAPRLNFWASGNSALSLGFPLSLGWSDFKNPHFASVDIPAEVDYHFGSGSTRENRKRFGFFAGAGYGFHIAIIHPPPISTYPAFPVPSGGYTFVRDFFSGSASDPNSPMSMFGPTLNAGFRAAVGHKGKFIEFRFSYMKVLEVPEFLQNRFIDSYKWNLQNTIILGYGCFFSF